MDWKFVEQIEGIDVIFGGYIYYVFEEFLVIGNVVLGVVGKFGQWFGKVVLEWDDSVNKFRLVSSGCFLLKDQMLDEKVVLVIVVYCMEVECVFGQIVVMID